MLGVDGVVSLGSHVFLLAALDDGVLILMRLGTVVPWLGTMVPLPLYSFFSVLRVRKHLGARVSPHPAHMALFLETRSWFRFAT